MKVTVVSDIRFAQHVPGAIQFDAAQRMLFWVCPCGCNEIGAVDYKFVDCSGGRSKVTVTLGFDDECWRGELKDGEWNVDEGPSADA